MTYEIKALTLAGVLDQGIQILKDHFVSLFAIVAIAYLPFRLLVNFLDFGVNAETVFAPDLIEDERIAIVQDYSISSLLSLPLSFFDLFLFWPLTYAATVTATANFYLARPATIGNVLSRAVRMVIPLAITNTLIGLAVFGGLLLLVVPGFIFLFWFALADQVVIIEGTHGPKALGRSRALMKGNIGVGFVLGLFTGLIEWFGIEVFASFPSKGVQVIGATLVQTSFLVIEAVIFVVFYYSCRCKLENFDLAILVDEIVDESAPVG